MPCNKPLTGFRSLERNASGKYSLVFNESKVPVGTPKIVVPCGQCMGCRLEKSRQWAVRCVNEGSLYDDNCVVNLTYNPEFLPANGSLQKRDVQLFIKRLRKRFPLSKIRYLYCGEYGENNSRPHYHMILFGFDFPDREYFAQSPSGNKIYKSEILNSLWSTEKYPIGHADVMDLSMDAAAYVARYTTKKINGEMADEHYQVLNEYGEYVKILPEFIDMSRRPGIGKQWLEKNIDRMSVHDHLIINGKKQFTTKYYDRLLSTLRPEDFEVIKNLRISNCTEFDDSLRAFVERCQKEVWLKVNNEKNLIRSYEK